MSVTVHRIDADAADDQHGPAYGRIQAHDPSVGPAEWRRILEFLPPDRVRTHVRLNEEGWSSSSDLLFAVAECEAVADLLATLPADGWLDRKEAWAAAEQADQELADAGGATILCWRRPLVRLGALVTVTAERGLPSNAQALLSEAFGDTLLLSGDDTRMTLVLAGMQQNLEARLVATLLPD